MNRLTFNLVFSFAFIAAFTVISNAAFALPSLPASAAEQRFNIAKLPESSTAQGPHIQVALLSEYKSIWATSDANAQWLGILLAPEDEWHTYWRNAGDSGEPPSVQWQSNAEIEFGEIQWPMPEQIPVAHLVNYGYSVDTLLMVPFTIKNSADLPETVKVIADLSWLVCKEDCIPGWATLTIELPVSDKPANDPSLLSPHAPLFSKTRATLPDTNWLSAQYEITDDYLTLATSLPYASNWQLLPFRSDLIQHNSQQQWLLAENDADANVLLKKSDYFSNSEATVNFLLTDGAKGFYVKAKLNDVAVVGSVTGLDGVPAMGSELDTSIGLMLIFAFIGGLILNIMPCVLPVLSLKALALASDKHQKHSPTGNYWSYLLGILVSFWLFAALILVLKASGEAIGWGFHLQQPLVIAALCFLFVFIALMLLDVVPNGAGILGFSGFSDIGQKLTQGNSFASQFFTGVLAVIVASPCTAPFMATALGVAMVSPPVHTVLIFTALALGFALPMTLLSLSPRFAALLPKPGAWMETFKQFLAFPMLATVIWLLWVFLGQTNSLGQLWLLSGLLLFALCLWLASKMAGKTSYASVVVALFIASYASYQGSEQVGTHSAESTNNKYEQIAQPFSEQKLAALRNTSQVVVVNMTADWCITCKVNEQVAFTDSDLRQTLAQETVHYLVGDWTNKNSEILAYLTRYQRSGVPLYVVYAGGGKGQVLPQILTPNIVITAIQQAQQELNYVSL
ncbi:protein-disulfide reductase DsbD family protein [Thalassotalea montiporae]